MHQDDNIEHNDGRAEAAETIEQSDFNYDISRRSLLRHGLRSSLTLGAAARQR